MYERSNQELVSSSRLTSQFAKTVFYRHLNDYFKIVVIMYNELNIQGRNKFRLISFRDIFKDNCIFKEMYYAVLCQTLFYE